MAHKAYPVHFYDPRMPLTSFMALDTRLRSANASSRPQTAFERSQIYGTDWISRRRTTTPSDYLRKQNRPRKIKTGDSVKKQADVDRERTLYLKNSTCGESLAWLAEKEKLQKKHQKKEKVSKEVKQKSEEYLKREKLQKKIDSKIVFQLWCDWKADPEAQADGLGFADYKEIRSNIDKQKLNEKEFPSYTVEQGLSKSVLSNSGNSVSLSKSLRQASLQEDSVKRVSIARPSTTAVTTRPKPLLKNSNSNDYGTSSSGSGTGLRPATAANFVFNTSENGKLRRSRLGSEKNLVTGKVSA